MSTEVVAFAVVGYSLCRSTAEIHNLGCRLRFCRRLYVGEGMCVLSESRMR